MEIALLVVLILVNGFFAMSEIGLISARKARLQPLADAGDPTARLAASLGAEPTKFLSTVQIGITSVGMLSGIVGEATLAPPVQAYLGTLGVTAPASGYIATVIVVLLVTYFAIVVGELVPKRIGQINAERVARLVAFPIHWLALASKPFVWLLTISTQALLRLLGIDDQGRSHVTEEEIYAVLAEGSVAGVIEEQERRMVRNLFRLDDWSVASLMTPRPDMVAMKAGSTPGEILAILESTPHSRYPVIRDVRQNVIGVVSARTLLLASLRGEVLDLEKVAEPPLFMPESATGMDVLESFRATDASLAFVVDEYGTVMGLVTMHDLVEAIAGEFMAASPDEARAVQREDGSWLLDGQIPMPEFIDRLDLTAADADAAADFDTLSGLILHVLGSVPRTAERVQWRGWTFEVMDMDRHRIDKVLATRRRTGH
jgi:putative hemolysin